MRVRGRGWAGYLIPSPEVKPSRPPVTSLPLPPIPWQITGNHWLSVPCIHPADGSIHAVGALHRGARSAIEVAGGPDFERGTAPALLAPSFEIDGVRHELSGAQIAWERAMGWVPTYTCTVGSLVVRATIFAPYGRDADMAGFVYALALENRSDAELRVAVSLEGTFGARQLRVRSPRLFDDADRVVQTRPDVIVLEGAAPPGLVALAIAPEAGGSARVLDAAQGRFAVRAECAVPPKGREHAAFYVAAGPERDGAQATVDALRRRGWRELLAATRDALRALEQTTGYEVMDRLINRNLLFAYFGAVGRALDDAHYYVVRTRMPWHGRGVTVRDWEALMWVVPAVLLADPPLARELLVRTCELHGYAPGTGVHYLDGTLFEPGFSLDGAAAFAVAVDRYIRESGDDQLVEEPVVADTLYVTWDDISARRDKRMPLYSTELTPTGAPATHPYTLHGNAVVAQALDVLRRTLDEETAREVEDPEAVRAALKRHFVVEQEGKGRFVGASDLAGGTATDEASLASALWLPLYDAVPRQDSTYRRTVRALGAGSTSLLDHVGRLLGPESSTVLQWLRRAPLDGGLAAESVDAEGKGTANGGDAALSGLLAWTAWYAVHALGERP